MKEALVYIDNQILSGDQAKISLFDLSFLRGFGVFDYLRTYQKVPFHLWDHLNRFKASAETVGIPLTHSLEDIQDIIETLLDKAPYPEANIKIFLTGGTTPDGFLPEDNPKFIAMVYPANPIPRTIYETGVSLLTKTYQRPYPTCKSIHYLTSIVGIRSAQKQGIHDVLYLDHDGHILETGRANFFAIKDGMIITPKENILLGVTRKVMINLIKDRGIPLEIRSISQDEIPTLDGAFLTASNIEVLPITQINDTCYPIHPHTLSLMQAFSEFTKNTSELSLRKL